MTLDFGGIIKTLKVHEKMIYNAKDSIDSAIIWVSLESYLNSILDPVTRFKNITLKEATEQLRKEIEK